MNTRVRYAPSPTGLQHIGGVRTALFNYLFARSQGGAFILRLEDTDRTRFDPVYVKNLYDTFAWLGVAWDEGPDKGGPAAPYVQSERTGLYREHAARLLDAGMAYRCFCAPERLDALRREREAAHSSESGYDRRCRAVPAAEAAARAAAGEPHTVRLRIPLGETTAFHDHLLGDIEWRTDDVSPDPVLLKSDGFPTYHLANVVDDHLMGITHVLRAQEWLSSTPLHVILYRAFGWEPPAFCHLPLIMGADGKKLSKRHGATSVDEFRRQGILPEALLNYIALVGASYEEGRDLYTLDELASRFSLDKLSRASGVFDYKKLEWYNSQYIRRMTPEALADAAVDFAAAAGLFEANGEKPTAEQRRRFVAAMPLVRERAVDLREIPGRIAYLFREPEVPAPQEFLPKKAGLAETVGLLRAGRDLAAALAQAPTDEAAEALAAARAQEAGVKLGDLLMPLRVAVTGTRVSPPLFGSLRILGAEAAADRVDRALARLERAAGAAPAPAA